jgi:large subunit ribosomal protein L6
MSRIGNAPIPLPAGVSVEQNNGLVTVKGPKGTLSRALDPEMQIEIEGSAVHVRRPSEEGRHKSMHGLTRTLLANMVEGVSQGFRKILELRGLGYRAQLQGKKLAFQIGFSHPVELDPPDGIAFVILDTFVPTLENSYLCARIAVDGIDKELVGQTAATMRAFKKPEPYKGKGIRYQGEFVRRKAGKAAKAQR